MANRDVVMSDAGSAAAAAANPTGTLTRKSVFLCEFCKTTINVNQLHPLDSRTQMILCVYCEKRRRVTSEDIWCPPEFNMTCAMFLQEFHRVQVTGGYGDPEALNAQRVLSFTFREHASSINKYLIHLSSTLARGRVLHVSEMGPYDAPCTISSVFSEVSALVALFSMETFYTALPPEAKLIENMFKFLNYWRLQVDVQAGLDSQRYNQIALILRALAGMFRSRVMPKAFLDSLGEQVGEGAAAKQLAFWVSRFWKEYDDAHATGSTTEICNTCFLQLHDAAQAAAAFCGSTNSPKNMEAFERSMPGVTTILDYVSDRRCEEIPQVVRVPGFQLLIYCGADEIRRRLASMPGPTETLFAVRCIRCLQELLDGLDTRPASLAFRTRSRAIECLCGILRMMLLDQRTAQILCGDELPRNQQRLPDLLYLILSRGASLSASALSEAAGCVWNVAVKLAGHHEVTFSSIEFLVPLFTDFKHLHGQPSLVDRAFGALSLITRQAPAASLILAKACPTIVDYICDLLRDAKIDTATAPRMASTLLHLTESPEALEIIGLQRPTNWEEIINMLRTNPQNVSSLYTDKRVYNNRQKLTSALYSVALRLFPKLRERNFFQELVVIVGILQELGLLREAIERKPNFVSGLPEDTPANVGMAFQLISSAGSSAEMSKRLVRHPTDESLSIVNAVIAWIVKPPHSGTHIQVFRVVIMAMDKLFAIDEARRLAVNAGILIAMLTWFIAGRQTNARNYAVFAEFCDSLRASLQIQPRVAADDIARLPVVGGVLTSPCAICFLAMGVEETLPDGTRGTRVVRKMIPCGHPYHENCLREWVHVHGKNSCPVCRAPMEIPGDSDPEYQLLTIFREKIASMSADPSSIPQYTEPELVEALNDPIGHGLPRASTEVAQSAAGAAADAGDEPAFNIGRPGLHRARRRSPPR